MTANEEHLWFDGYEFPYEAYTLRKEHLRDQTLMSKWVREYAELNVAVSRIRNNWDYLAISKLESCIVVYQNIYDTDRRFFIVNKVLPGDVVYKSSLDIKKLYFIKRLDIRTRTDITLTRTN